MLYVVIWYVCAMYDMCGKDRKVKRVRTGRSIRVGLEGLPGPGRKSPETPGSEDPIEHGLERRMCCMWYFGETH